MGRRISLPMTDTLGSEGAPTTATMRKQLGGRIVGAMSVATPKGVVTVGSFVELTSADGAATKSGVLLTVEGDAVDVYMAGGLVRRTRADFIAPKSRAAEDLAPIAESAAVFARLGEGQAVEVEREGSVERGTLVEKCRYGALVQLANDVVLAVGFRKVWPAVVASQSQS